MSATPPTAVPTSEIQWPANWYPDPQKEAPYRYWNGERWTERTRDTKPISPALIGALASCLAIIIGSIGPWISSGLASASGTDNGSDGRYTLAAGVIAAICIGVYYLGKGDHGWLVWPTILGAGCVYAAVVDIQDINSRHATVFGTDISPSTGWGIWLMAAGGVALAVSSFFAYRVGQPQRRVRRATA